MRDISYYIGYKFKNQNILKSSLSHPSLNIKDDYDVSYEKLEFLGDAILSFVITEFLIKEFKCEKEGDLAKRRSMLVSSETLVDVANKINLGSYMIMSDGEDSYGGRSNKSNLENCIESLIGAIYLDGGIDPALEFIKNYWFDTARSIINPPNNPKSELQEWSQKYLKIMPEYRLIKSEGLAHSPNFTIELTISNKYRITAIAKSKKEAEQKAATILLSEIKKENNK